MRREGAEGGMEKSELKRLSLVWAEEVRGQPMYPLPISHPIYGPIQDIKVS
jgi:hypothetical protein